MVYYLNFGFVLEQAVADIIRRYFDRQKFDDVYGNFHISVVNEHPFAHMIIENNPRCADNFPAVVVTSQSDSKTAELSNLPQQCSAVGYTSEDLNRLFDCAYRNKKKMNSDGEFVDVIKKGVVQKERIPGFILVYDEETINRLKEIADSRNKDDVKGMVYGFEITARKTDRVSIEIWSENNELKNELYEHIRLLLSGTMPVLLKEMYGIFNPVLFDKTVNGERSSNFNFDFDTLLCGSHIAFEVDYDIAQIVLDTDLNDINREVITEVINHVKNENRNS
nr:MAG TPA: hypothetical protein [Bacteriophage sp.]